VAVVLAANPGEACEECRLIPGAYPGWWWCTYTDCTASAECLDVPDHSYCIPLGGCTGTLPKWLCALYPSAACQDTADTSLPQDSEALSFVVPIGQAEQAKALGSQAFQSSSVGYRKANKIVAVETLMDVEGF
jgi:hypothetical protein